MRKTIILGSAIAIALVSCGEKKSAPVALNNEIDSLSYAVGVILAENAKQMKEADSLNNSLITAGFENIINDNAPKMRMESHRIGHRPLWGVGRGKCSVRQVFGQRIGQPQ